MRLRVWASFGITALLVTAPATRAPASLYRARAVAKPDDVFALSLAWAKTPPVRAAHVYTRGTFPEVAGLGADLRHVNAALRTAVLDDERAFASGVPKGEVLLNRPRGDYGAYETDPVRRLISASTVVVSALIPTLELYPGGADGQWWLSVTVQVSTGHLLDLSDLFASPQRGLAAIATAVRRTLPAENACVRASLADPILGKDFSRSFDATWNNYRYFALTTEGLAIGFPVGQVAGPVCGRAIAVVPYSVVIPYTGELGRQLIRGIRRPEIPRH